MQICHIKGQPGPSHSDHTLAARLERIAVLALVGIANFVNGLLRIDALGNILFPGVYLKGCLEEQAVATQSIHKVNRRSTRVQSGIGRGFRRIRLGLPLNFVWRSLGFFGFFGRWAAGATAQSGNSQYEKAKNVCVTVHQPCPRFPGVFVRI
jgi:hypothetical protein